MSKVKQNAHKLLDLEVSFPIAVKDIILLVDGKDVAALSEKGGAPGLAKLCDTLLWRCLDSFTGYTPI